MIDASFLDAVPMFVWWFAAAAAFFGLGWMTRWPPGARYLYRTAAAIAVPGVLNLFFPWVDFLYQAFTCLVSVTFVVPRWRTQHVGGSHLQAVVTRGYLIGDRDLEYRDQPIDPDEEENRNDGWGR